MSLSCARSILKYVYPVLAEDLVLGCAFSCTAGALVLEYLSACIPASGRLDGFSGGRCECWSVRRTLAPASGLRWRS